MAGAVLKLGESFFSSIFFTSISWIDLLKEISVKTLVDHKLSNSEFNDHVQQRIQSLWK